VELRIISKALHEIGPEEVTDDDLPKIYAGRRPDHTNATEDSKEEREAREEIDHLSFLHSYSI
jgi:hypothetical protein